MAMVGQDERLSRANQLIAIIASCGHKFFRRGERVATLELDDNRRVWFVDEYHGSRIFTHHKGEWRKFTGGGTLRFVIERLRDFVKMNRALPGQIFGPWPDWICGGDLWGYGKDMEQVRSAAVRLSIT